LIKLWKKGENQNESPNILEGDRFAWSMKGIGDFEFAKLDLNKSTEELQVSLIAGTPHKLF
jgi:hypothetical protein